MHARLAARIPIAGVPRYQIGERAAYSLAPKRVLPEAYYNPILEGGTATCRHPIHERNSMREQQHTEC